jgi:hypothetical protein
MILDTREAIELFVFRQTGFRIDGNKETNVNGDVPAFFSMPLCLKGSTGSS